MNTNEKFAITISREVGTGGRTIGRKLAQKLGVRYCDKELIKKLKEMFGLNEAEIERIKGQKKNWLPKGVEYAPDVTSNEIFSYESKILTTLAEESSCVIAGRSGFFVLKDHPNKFDVFIHASRANRISRIMKRQELSEEEAVEVIEYVDKARENYVRKYADTSRYDLRNYDLVLNMDYLTEDEAVECILKAISK